MTPLRPITLLVVDDHQLVREGLKALLENYPQFEIVAEACSAKEAVRLAFRHKPDVVLMDVKMPGNGGLTACREILAALPQTKVIILTGYDDRKTLFAAIAAGAVGYVLKTMRAEPLVNAIEQVIAGGVAVDPELGMALFETIRRRQVESLTGAVALADFINKAFNVSELKDLCRRLDVEYDDLEGETKHERAAELVLYFERRGDVKPLVKMVKRLRPNFKTA